MSDNPCMQGDGYVSHDFIGDKCIKCGKSASPTLLVCPAISEGTACFAGNSDPSCDVCKKNYYAAN